VKHGGLTVVGLRIDHQHGGRTAHLDFGGHLVNCGLQAGHCIRTRRGGRCRGRGGGHWCIVVPRRQCLLLGQRPTLGATFSDGPEESLRLPALAELGEETVLQLQLGIHVLARRTGAGLHEALLEVVAEEGVQDGVHGRVGVAEAAAGQEHGQLQAGRTALRGRANQSHLRNDKSGF